MFKLLARSLIIFFTYIYSSYADNSSNNKYYEAFFSPLENLRIYCIDMKIPYLYKLLKNIINYKCKLFSK